MSKVFSLSQEDVMARIRAIHGDKYDLSQVVYKTINDPVTLVCGEHGPFNIKPRFIFQQHQGCRACGYKRSSEKRRLSREEFISRAVNLHGDLYDYSKVLYVKNNVKVEIVCKKHGSFMQTPDGHLTQKQGCPLCSNKRKNNKGGYSHTYFQNHPDDKQKPAILYAAKFTHNRQQFIKIGITAKTTHHRFSRSEYKHMEIDVLYEKNTTLYDAFCEEQMLLHHLAHCRFFPADAFSGYTECFRVTEQVQQKIIEVFVNNTSVTGTME